jgi:flavin reductase (DIM6/NTAB) family NADH-FMN oxidoreductase RutF
MRPKWAQCSYQHALQRDLPISATGRYGVNVWPDHGATSRHFASQPNTGASPDYDIVDGLPRLSGCIAWSACEVTRHVDVSDHTLIIAEVSSCDYRDTTRWCFFQPVSSGAGRAGGSVRGHDAVTLMECRDYRVSATGQSA